MKKSILAAAVAAALLSGCGVAAATPQATPQSPVPQACLDALDDADALIDISIAMNDIMVDVLDAVATFDVAGIDRSDDIAALTRQVERSTYPQNRDACRGQS